ncbi:hypothetical protein [Rhizobium leguminosarum]|uniref:hypothetical protein n=1 Tax=Rhizobium leguminosarum TaxID=384 RepID=UPI0012FA3CCE|nr:hypothetical protein [Rhizobium leguminosarum]MVO95063.1 hypothetical protein [Rhizobium leguminosarum bv. phaseoli]
MKSIEMILGFALRMCELFVKAGISLVTAILRIAGSAIMAGLARHRQPEPPPNVIPFQRRRRKKKWPRTLH